MNLKPKWILAGSLIIASAHAFASEGAIQPSLQPIYRSKASNWLLEQYKKPTLTESKQTVLIYLRDQASLANVGQSA